MQMHYVLLALYIHQTNIVKKSGRVFVSVFVVDQVLLNFTFSLSGWRMLPVWLLVGGANDDDDDASRVGGRRIMKQTVCRLLKEVGNSSELTFMSPREFTSHKPQIHYE